MEVFMQCVFSGIAQGAIYGLIALGYSMIFSTMRMGHFAQGDFYMFGACLAYQVLSLWTMPPWFGVIFSIVGTAVLMLITERLVYRQMYTRAGMGLLMSTMGMQFIVQEISILLWGSEVKKIAPLFSTGTVQLDVLGMRLIISIENVMLIVICAGLMILIALFMKFTKTGVAMSAVSMNRKAAQLMGVKLTTIIATTYIMAAALAAISGFLMGPRFSVFYSMGAATGSRAMTAAVLGGFGSMPGAMLGGVLLGIVETLCSYYISTAYKDVFSFLLLIIVLFWRPQGILGRRSVTKV